MARLIRASEVGEYVFCHRAWWLRTIEKLTPESQARMAAGVASHHRHGLRVALSRALMIAGLGLLVGAGLALLLGR